MSRFVLLWVMLAMCGLAQSGELYRWVGAQGKVHYGDVPPVAATQVETKRFVNPVDDGNYMPYETSRAHHNFPVILFVSESCGEYCDQARELLIKRGIPFAETMLVTKVEIDAFKQASGDNKLPTLQVGKNYLRGFEVTRWHSELDAGSYPQTSSYRQPVSPAPSAENETAPMESTGVANGDGGRSYFYLGVR